MNHARVIRWIPRVTVIALLCVAACGDDDTSTGDAGPTAGKGTGGKGGAGGKGGSGGKAGGSAKAGTGGTAAAAGLGGMMITCSEPAPKDPVKCGGETCVAPADFAMNMCVIPCCASVGGKEVCASKSTAMGISTECVLPAKPDTSCPNVDAMGTPLVGCCNAEKKKCGIISTLRPGCITESMLVTLPSPLQDCTPPEVAADDAGAPDAG